LAAAALLPFLVFAAHGAFFASWEMDDAGISYAYARNLATGDGLIAQHGAEPVEGFTNILWVLILASVLPLVESPGLAAKVLSHGFVLCSFLVMAVGMRSWFPRRWFALTTIGLTVSSLLTGFPAWTLSGLENGLYIFLVAVLLVGTTSASDSRRGGVAVAATWVLLFATRPDAAPLIVIPAVIWGRRRYRRAVMTFAPTAAAGFAGMTAFRVLYFGDVLPNTYYAKRAIGSELLALVRWTPSSGLLFGLLGFLLLSAGVLSLYLLAARGPWPAHPTSRRLGALALWLTVIVSYLTFETLPTDWMPEGRLATPIFLLGPLALLSLVRRGKWLLGVTGAALLVSALGYSWRHTPAFANVPPVPFRSVLELADRLDSVGRALHLDRRTTVLLPDIGGALWADQFTVLDLGGLIDRRIARTLRAEDQREFYDYILEQREPDLIWSHGYWEELVNFARDSRVAQEYEILFEEQDRRLYLRSQVAAGLERTELLAAFLESRPSPR
jgi:hypothetical protein